MKDTRGWKRMMFKGMKVWLNVDDAQQTVVHDNKVLIKYQLDQDHEYWVRKEAVEPIVPSRLRKKTRKNKAEHRSSLAGEHDDQHDPFPPNTIEAYTDGASSGNPGPAGIGIFLRFGSKEKEISKHIGIATNNVAELMAIETALKAIRTTQIPVRLYTDSQYCFGLLSLGWKPKRNEKLVAAIKTLMKRFKDLKIRKIKAHAGIDDNERADYLARKAVTGRGASKGRSV